MRTRQGAHFFVEAEEEKKGGPLRQKFISGKDEFPTYTCLKMCSNDTLPQGSAACAARRLRLFPRLERGVKSAKMLLIQSSILMANIPPPSACPPPRSLFRRASRSLRIPSPSRFASSLFNLRFAQHPLAFTAEPLFWLIAHKLLNLAFLCAINFVWYIAFRTSTAITISFAGCSTR